jgi:hypothetical protein
MGAEYSTDDEAAEALVNRVIFAIAGEDSTDYRAQAVAAINAVREFDAEFVKSTEQ